MECFWMLLASYTSYGEDSFFRFTVFYVVLLCLWLSWSSILTDGDALFSPCHFDFNTLRDDIDTQPCRETETELSGCGCGYCFLVIVVSRLCSQSFSWVPWPLSQELHVGLKGQPAQCQPPTLPHRYIWRPQSVRRCLKVFEGLTMLNMLKSRTDLKHLRRRL